jgi:hypothetical protein
VRETRLMIGRAVDSFTESALVILWKEVNVGKASDNDARKSAILRLG